MKNMKRFIRKRLENLYKSGSVGAFGKIFFGICAACLKNKLCKGGKMCYHNTKQEIKILPDRRYYRLFIMED